MSNELARKEHEKAGRLLEQAQSMVKEAEGGLEGLDASEMETYRSLIDGFESHIERRDEYQKMGSLGEAFDRDSELVSELTGMADHGEADARILKAPDHIGALDALRHGRVDHPDTEIVEGDRKPSIVLRQRNWYAWRELRDSGLTPREVRDQMEADALSIASPTAGGNTIPTIIENRFFGSLFSINGWRKWGATTISTSGGEPHQYPVEVDPTVTHTWDTDNVSALQTGEGVAAAAREPATDFRTLTPRKYTALTTVSSELLADSAVSIGTFVSNMLGRTLGRMTELAYAQGRGHANQEPDGMFRHETVSATSSAGLAAGLTTTLATRNTLTYAELNTAAYAADDYDTSGVAWFLKKPTVARITGLLGTDGHPIFRLSAYRGGPGRLGANGMPMGEQGELLGYPVYINTYAGNMNGANQYVAVLGPPSEYWIRDVDSISMRVYDQTKGLEDQLDYVARLRTDGVIMNKTHFSWLREHA